MARSDPRDDVLVLAHAFSRPEVQDFADVVGDSLELVLAACASDCPFLVVAGVHFLAETIAILVPDRVVVHPEPLAQCAMAARLTVAGIEKARARYPGVPIVTLVNSPAAAKAVSDICCTSANAISVVESLGVSRILFAPDRNLAAYIATQTGVEVIPVPALGCCPMHQALSPDDISNLLALHPRAELMVHPATAPAVQALAGFIGSVPALIRRVQMTDATTAIVGTDTAVLSRMRRLAPHQILVPASHLMSCPDMRMTTLPSVRDALRTREPVVRVDPSIATRARRAIERMLAVTGWNLASGPEFDSAGEKVVGKMPA